MRSLALACLALVACSEPAPSGPAPSGPPPSDPSASEPSASEPSASEQSAREASSPAGLIAPAALAATLPDALGAHTARADAEHGHERAGVVVTTWASRAYRREEAVAHVRVVDATRAPDLIMGFAAAQQIELPSGPDGFELLPTGVGGRPALASWDPGRASSEAQVLVRGRVIVAVAVQGARTPEEALELLDGAPLDALEALLR